MMERTMNILVSTTTVTFGSSRERAVANRRVYEMGRSIIEANEHRQRRTLAIITYTGTKILSHYCSLPTPLATVEASALTGRTGLPFQAKAEGRQSHHLISLSFSLFPLLLRAIFIMKSLFPSDVESANHSGPVFVYLFSSTPPFPLLFFGISLFSSLLFSSLLLIPTLHHSPLSLPFTTMFALQRSTAALQGLKTLSAKVEHSQITPIKHGHSHHTQKHS